MKTEPKVGDYVSFTKPYVGRYPIGVIVDDSERWHPDIVGVDHSKQIYRISFPDGSVFWRQSKDLKKSSYEEYTKKNFLEMLKL